MSISKYQLRQKATPFSIGTTDLKKSRGSLMDTSGCIALLVTSGYGIATVIVCIHNQLLLNNLQVISQKYGRNL